MLFPRASAFQGLFGVVDRIVEIATVERAEDYLWRPFFSPASGGAKGGAADRAGSPLGFTVALVGGVGSEFYYALIDSEGERGWTKTSIICGERGGVASGNLLLRESILFCQAMRRQSKGKTTE